MKDIIILFGEMGSGKNYHGERIAKNVGWPFIDGDSFLTDSMLEAINKFEFLSREIIQSFVYELCSNILLRINDSPGLVVVQALYSNEDRKYLDTILTRHGYKVSWIWIKPSFIRNLKQLYSRENGLSWIKYWLLNKPWFQKPKLNCSII